MTHSCRYHPCCGVRWKCHCSGYMLFAVLPRERVDFQELSKIPIMERIPLVGLYYPVTIVGFLSSPWAWGCAEQRFWWCGRGQSWALWDVGDLTLLWHWKLSREIMLSLSDEPSGTADTAFLFKCKQLFMVQESISHCPAQTFWKNLSSPWIFFKNLNLISIKLTSFSVCYLHFALWTMFEVYLKFSPTDFMSRNAVFLKNARGNGS